MDRSKRDRLATTRTQYTSTCWLHYYAPHRHCSATWCALPLELVENLRVAIRLGASANRPRRTALQLKIVYFRWKAECRDSSDDALAALLIDISAFDHLLK